MDFLNAYENDYREDRAKILTADEKAYMEGYTKCVSDFKDNIEFYIGHWLKNSTFDKIRKEVIVELEQYLDCCVASNWCENLICLADAHGDEKELVVNKTYKWNKKKHKVNEPVDLVDE